jgi:hypothetical protein
VGSWQTAEPGVLVLPSGRLLRGRALRAAVPPGPHPEYGLYLLATSPPAVTWASNWLRWPDFGLPSDRLAARNAFLDIWERAEHQRVEVACGGGHGRTGTALACIAVIDGHPATDAVQYVREHYSPHAVETPWQRRYVRRFKISD